MNERKMISHIDHVVLTVSDLDVSLQFYVRVLGMEAIVLLTGGRHYDLAIRK